MNVAGKAKVYHNEKDGRQWVTISDSSKDRDGNRVYQSYNARFKDGEPTHESFIDYKGFMTYYKADSGKVYTTVQVMEWEYVDKQEKAPSKIDKNTPLDEYGESAIIINDDSLPF